MTPARSIVMEEDQAVTSTLLRCSCRWHRPGVCVCPGDMLVQLSLVDNGFQVMALEPLNGINIASFWFGRDAKLLEGGLIVSVDRSGNALVMPREPGLPLTWVPRKWIGSVQTLRRGCYSRIRRTADEEAGRSQGAQGEAQGDKAEAEHGEGLPPQTPAEALPRAQ